MTTTNLELLSVCKYLKISLIGVFMRNELNNLLPSAGRYIINLEDTNHIGTHWCALLLTDKEAFYFDSFGEPAPLELETFVRNSSPRRIYGYNITAIQSLKSDYCGWYCIFLFLSIHNNKVKDIFKSANDYINSFNINNEARKGVIIVNDEIIRSKASPYKNNKIINRLLLNNIKAY